MEIGYYRLIKPFEENDDKTWKIGKLWYFVGWDGDQATIIQGERKWHIDEESFLNCFKFAPNGFTEQQLKMSELMTELYNISTRSDLLLEQQKTLPAITVQEEEDSNISEETSLVVSNQMADKIASHSLVVKKVKTSIASIRRQITRRNKELHAMIKEQEMALKEKTKLLEKQMEIASEIIYVLNAYLGKDEELVRIKDGKRASKDEQIIIRQLVLYMDEEAAAAEDWAEKGGMDFKDIAEFDKWVIKPKNLNIVCPDKKGIVAIKPRRNDKYYSNNPFVNSYLNRENKCLYILVRNGDLVYRIHTSLWMGSVFFPRKNEFESFFYSSCYNHKSGKSEREPMKPGSAAYMKAMEAADKRYRRYFAALLLIQGILDRTKIFRPLPVARLNILNFDESAKYCKFLQDAENLLGDNRPSFLNWLKDINKKINVGCRIIVNFKGYEDKFSGSYNYEGETRKWPKYARNPQSNCIYVLEKEVEKFKFKFYYSREGETVYSGWDYRPSTPKNRASYVIYSSDCYFLNFDAATVEDMEHYMNSRIHRHEYKTMLPLMKIACEMKKHEAEEEAPFRKLLMGEIMKKHDVSQSIAESYIDKLIKWFKFKNLMHRSLNSEDAKALRMIVKEFGNRWKLEKQQIVLAEEHKLVVKSLHEDVDNNLIIFHRRNNEYIVFRFMNDENVYIQEERWTNNPEENKLKCYKEKAWTTVDAHHHSWTILWKHKRWEEWNLNAVVSEHFTDPEREEAIKFGLKVLKERDLEKIYNHWSIKNHKKDWLLPLAAVVTTDEKFYIYYIQNHAKIDEKSLNDLNEYPEIGRLEIIITKKKGKENTYCVNQSTIGISLTDDHLPWSENYKKKGHGGCLHTGMKFKKCLNIFPKNIQAGLAEYKKVELAKEKIREMLRPANCISNQVRDAVEKSWWQEEYIKFNEEYDDPDGDLWEDYKEDASGPSTRYLFPVWVEEMTHYLIEKGIDPNGMTIEEGAKLAKLCGKFDKIKAYNKVKSIIMNTSYGEQE